MCEEKREKNQAKKPPPHVNGGDKLSFYVEGWWFNTDRAQSFQRCKITVLKKKEKERGEKSFRKCSQSLQKVHFESQNEGDVRVASRRREAGTGTHSVCKGLGADKTVAVVEAPEAGARVHGVPRGVARNVGAEGGLHAPGKHGGRRHCNQHKRQHTLNDDLWQQCSACDGSCGLRVGGWVGGQTSAGSGVTGSCDSRISFTSVKNSRCEMCLCGSGVLCTNE